MAEINNVNDNKIAIPWYTANVHKVHENNTAISNVKFNIRLPDEKSKTQEAQKPQENKARERQKNAETEKEGSRGKMPIPAFPPLPERKPQGEEQPEKVPVTAAEPSEWKTAAKVGQVIWNSWSTEEKADFVFNLAHGFTPNEDEENLWKGARYAAAYNYSDFNMGEYWNGLVLTCGLMAAITIMAIMVTLVVMPK